MLGTLAKLCKYSLKSLKATGWYTTHKLQSLTAIALIYEEIGYQDKASQLLTDATSIALEIENPDYVDDGLVIVIQAYGELDDKSAAQIALRKIISVVATLDTRGLEGHEPCLSTGYIDGIGSIEEETLCSEEARKISLLSTLARTYTTIEESELFYQDLFSLLDEVKLLSTFAQSRATDILSALTPIFGRLNIQTVAETGLNEIWEIVESWEDSEYKVTQMLAVSQAFAAIDQPIQSIEILNQILDLISSSENDFEKSSLFAKLLETIGEIEDINVTQEILKTIIQGGYLSAHGNDPNFYLLASRAYYGLDDLKMANSLLQAAQGLAEAETGQALNPRLLGEIATGYIVLGDFDTAYETLARAVDSAEKIPDNGWSSIELSIIIPLYPYFGDDPIIRDGLEQALSVARSFEEPLFKARTFNSIAIVYRDIGDEETANLILCENLEAATTQIEDAYFQAEILTGVLAIYNELDSLALSETCIPEISRFASSMQDSEEHSYSSHKSEVFRSLALTYLEAGEPALAEKSLESALSAAHQIEYPFDELVEIAALYIQF